MLAIRLMQLFSDNDANFSKLAGILGLYFQIRDDYCNLCLLEVSVFGYRSFRQKIIQVGLWLEEFLKEKNTKYSIGTVNLQRKKSLSPLQIDCTIIKFVK